MDCISYWFGLVTNRAYVNKYRGIFWRMQWFLPPIFESSIISGRPRGPPLRARPQSINRRWHLYPPSHFNPIDPIRITCPGGHKGAPLRARPKSINRRWHLYPPSHFNPIDPIRITCPGMVGAALVAAQICGHPNIMAAQIANAQIVAT